MWRLSHWTTGEVPALTFEPCLGWKPVPGPDPAPVQPPRGSALLSFHPIPPHPHLAPVVIGLIGLVKPEARPLTNLQHQSESCQETELPPDDSPEET